VLDAHGLGHGVRADAVVQLAQAGQLGDEQGRKATDGGCVLLRVIDEALDDHALAGLVEPAQHDAEQEERRDVRGCEPAVDTGVGRDAEVVLEAERVDALDDVVERHRDRDEERHHRAEHLEDGQRRPEHDPAPGRAAHPVYPAPDGAPGVRRCGEDHGQISLEPS
jgi:hypothetical protein